jgi:hypothetical protein
MKTFFTALLLCSTSLALAQKKVPSFDQIDPEDIQMTACDLDAGAYAYKLLDLGDVSYTSGRSLFQMNMTRRVRIKVLKDKGIELANVKIPFYNVNDIQKITDIKAVTYNIGADGNIVKSKLGKEAIYNQKIDKRYSFITFTIPDVKVGSVFEYQYTDVTQSPTKLENWFFQDVIPTRFSSYRVQIPSFFKYAKELLTYQPVQQTSQDRFEMTNIGNHTALKYNITDATYTMEKVPALKKEPFMSSFRNYQQRLEFQLVQIQIENQVISTSSTWPRLSRVLLDDEDFGQQIKKSLPKTESLRESLKGITDIYKKMVVVHDFVRSNMTWNGRESVFSGQGVKEAWDKKSGSNGDINLILLNLLKDAGVPAKPLLVSTRDNGGTDMTNPTVAQFNNVMAYVELGDKFYVMNAADKYNPTRLIPDDVVNTDAYVIAQDSSKWISLFNLKQKWTQAVNIVADIDVAGVMKGEAMVSNYDYSRNPRIRTYKEKRANFNSYFTDDNPGISIENVNVDYVDEDSLPLEQKVTFNSQLNTSGDYKYFKVNLFTGLEKNPFIADERTTDIEFGYNQSYAIIGNISIPENYKLEEMPQNISMIMPDTSISLKRYMQLEGNNLTFRIMVDFSRPYYDVKQYPEFKEFNKKLYAKLNEQIVLKKKS